MQYEIEVYETENKKLPFDLWLNKQDHTLRGIISAKLRKMSLGNLGICEPVGDGISEVKINLGAGYRIYFIIKARKILLLLCAGEKKTQSKDIQKAKEYLKDYKKRGKSHVKK